MDEKSVEVLNNSRGAVVAFELFKPFLDKERAFVLAKMKDEFRSNRHELSVYIGLISTLVSLDDLENKMLKLIKAGKSVGEKVITDV
jgi:hypothetical protein